MPALEKGNSELKNLLVDQLLKTKALEIGVFGPIRNDPKVQARSRENGIPVVFVHPVEFLVTGPDGSILERTVLGDVPEGKPPPDHFLTSTEQIGSAPDSQGVYYFDLPLP